MDGSTPDLSTPAPGSLLLVDDEENILSSLHRLLRRDGYRIHLASSGQAALDILTHETIDVIVSDQRMPGMTGTEFLRRARDLCPDTIRMVLSGYTELQSVTSAINEGSVYKFLTKPWDDQRLRTIIADAMRRKQMDDENRRLHIELGFAHAHLKVLLAERERRIDIGEASLHFAHETLAALPLAVIGVDSELLVVLANTAAQRMFNNPMVGLPVDLVLPKALLPILDQKTDDYVRYQLTDGPVSVFSSELGNANLRGRVFVFFHDHPGVRP